MTVPVPKYNELLMPTLLAVQSLGGSGSIPEIVAAVIRVEGLSEDQQAVLHNEGPVTEIGYRVAWARSYLKASACSTTQRAASGHSPSLVPTSCPIPGGARNSWTTSCRA